MYKLAFFVPPSHVEEVKDAMFSAGGGCIGAYDCVSWQTLGEGQYRPGEGSSPFIGTPGQLEKLPEYKVEMVCAADRIRAVVAALKQAHPYEEVAFDLWSLANGELD